MRYHLPVVLASTLLAGLGLIGASGVASASVVSTPTWAVQATPNPPVSQGAQLNGVTCTSTGKCMSVGAYSTASASSITLAEFFNGSTWSIKATPGGGTDARLNGVACASATSCIAVGSIGSSPLIESWNGSTWKIDDSTGTGSLNEIKCSGSASCVAVGSNGNGKPLIESYNGSVWSIQAVPSTVTGTLYGVSCVTTASCFAVGDNNPGGGGTKPLILHWNGTAWASQGSPVISMEDGYPVDDVTLNSVGCFKSDCTAVGSVTIAIDGELPTHLSLAERWNGTSWAIQKTPNPGGTEVAYNSLQVVRCVSATNCTAAGAFGDADCCSVTWATHWNGTNWSTQNTSSVNDSWFNGLSCSTTACTAVGTVLSNENGDYLTLAEHN